MRDGRTFLRHLICLSKKVKHLNYKVKINSEVRGDISWWVKALTHHSDITMFPTPWVPENTNHVFSDASNVAGRAIYNDNWFCIPVVGDCKWLCSMPIGLFLVVKYVATFAHFFPNARGILHIDNKAVCYL